MCRVLAFTRNAAKAALQIGPHNALVVKATMISTHGQVNLLVVDPNLGPYFNFGGAGSE